MQTVLTRVNRVLLGLLGLALLALGGAALMAGLGVRVPSWWPFTGRGDVLLSAADRARWRDEGWWWPAVIAALAVVALLALWWLLAQLRRQRLAMLRVPDEEGPVLLRGRALERVLGEESEAVEGVDRAVVALTGRQSAPRVRIRLTVSPSAVPAEAVADLAAVAVARARESVRLERLPTEVRVRGAGGRGGAGRVR
ncbi:alkaline shock response membrane anchor protein AmaP [Streptomyces sp. CA-294286]|uniref:alkaline shock response membrane anchor protein AmaP n=1 Tax=Streptomyces sp. CA-294286 TaxID=3240070 RepID=UPI003D8F0825